MKRLKNVLGTSLIAVAILSGCQAESGSSEGQEEQAQVEEGVEATIELTKNEGAEEIAEKDITVEEGTVLLEAMEENFDLETQDGFITGIEGVSAEEGEQMAWIYTINGEEAMVGAGEYEIEEDDEIRFDFQAWE
ncbi:DUF4430 domain-containing protein [Salimicrobium halophilum]|uniref:Transcobalamin-like C-terminal domain-containing protein n=1 Tax=Salimicrobium halophilum TaxID=86666 RepID=A0A1G8PZ66_9BACI|nr:DUF4430 domain-containing protein [Salimicrobium halophilum]SDI97535.1 protein of unknown function [Salimicrobium halophilum]